MKIVICSVPLRPEKSKTVYPPLGAFAVIQSLQSAGYSASFYDINFYRPSEEEIRNYFLEHRFDVIGISATVATSYKFVKKLVSMIKTILPKTVIVVGGALTASSEVILKFNSVDHCVIGEGEKVIVDLMNYIVSKGKYKSEDELKKIKGLCFLSNGGDVVFTGYQKQLPAEEIQDIDYNLVKKYSDIDQYIIDPFLYEQFKYDERSLQRHRKNKRLATIITSRGCVHRCTFCYRWQSGIRLFPIDRVIKHIGYLIKNYNVGFISFGDENFGVAKKWTDTFIERIKPLDILYRIAGICCQNINPSILKRLKESGCVSIHYGFESGSNRMLKVMEKPTDVELNKKVARWTNEAGLQTVHHLLIGLPGESYNTIKETIDFVKNTTESWPRDPYISVNVINALPGTPVYEYARYKGFLGKTLKDEEKYLLRISDQGGGTSVKLINLTDYPYFIVLSWIRCICWAGHYHYYRKRNIPAWSVWKLFYTILQILFKRRKTDEIFYRNLYGSPVFYSSRYIIALLSVMYKNYKDNKKLFIERCFELLIYPFKKKTFKKYVSLRDFIYETVDYIKNIDKENIRILKLGR